MHAGGARACLVSGGETLGLVRHEAGAPTLPEASKAASAVLRGTEAGSEPSDPPESTTGRCPLTGQGPC